MLLSERVCDGKKKIIFVVMKIDKEIFDFLTDLACNNNREWFNANKERYNDVKHRFERITDEFVRLIVEIDSSVGMHDAKDCIYRIYRDTRFSSDKTPYKRHICCFVAKNGRKSRMPGYYLHIEPGSSHFGGGVYCLEPEELKRIRREICNFPEEIVAAVENDDFKSRMRLHDGDKMKKFPKGYETGFKGDEYLKYRYLSSYVTYSDVECMSDIFGDMLRRDMQLAYPLNRFLTEAMEMQGDDEFYF